MPKKPQGYTAHKVTQTYISWSILHLISWFADTELKSTGFTYIDDALPDEIKDFAFPEEVRKKMLLVTDQQVYEELHEMLMTDIKTPVQLVFRDSLCLDCGAQGDERLLDNYCHMDFQLIHPKNSILFHPEEKVPNFLILVLLTCMGIFLVHRNITIP